MDSSVTGDGLEAVGDCVQEVSEDGHPQTRDRRYSSEDWDARSASEYICPRCLQNFQPAEFW